MKRKNNKKLKLLSLLFIVLFVFISQTIVYSAINSTMIIKGNAYARAEADVRITDFILATTNKATSSYEEFGKSHIVTEVDLLDSSSYITYYLEITNYGSVDVGIFDITGLPSGVSYSIKDYVLKDKICNENNVCNSFIKKTYEITLTTNVAYAGSVQLEFDFRVFHKVTYTGITNNNYPTEVIDGGNLNITFMEDLNDVVITSNGAELGFYEQISNGQTITLDNIANDIEVMIYIPTCTSDCILKLTANEGRLYNSNNRLVETYSNWNRSNASSQVFGDYINNIITIVIEEDLPIISNYCFRGMGSLIEVKYLGTSPPACTNIFTGTNIEFVQVLPDFSGDVFCGKSIIYIE